MKEGPEQRIRNWFEAAGGGSLILPDGWFGRPYDSEHRLTFMAVRPMMVVIELDRQLLLVFTRLREAAVENSEQELRLVFRKFDQLVFDWIGYGDLTPHASIYTAGEVQFVQPIVGSSGTDY